MNELIRELARRAGFKRMNTERYAAISDEELDVFVKLIVEECANIATPAKRKEILEKFGLHND
jgi:hypothetical protein